MLHGNTSGSVSFRYEDEVQSQWAIMVVNGCICGVRVVRAEVRVNGARYESV